jgi:hypothetical protein
MKCRIFICRVCRRVIAGCTLGAHDATVEAIDSCAICNRK